MTSDSWEEETQDSAIWSLEIDSEDKWNQRERRGPGGRGAGLPAQRLAGRGVRGRLRYACREVAVCVQCRVATLIRSHIRNGAAIHGR